MRSLGRLVRGLSALFWGLPITLIVCVQTARTDWSSPFNVIPPILVTGMLVYGLCLLTDFQKQERVWRQALDRTRILAIVLLGLSPHLFWWNQMPGIQLFSHSVYLFALTAMAFLMALNHALVRLTAMLPDEALRVETRLFTRLNLWLLATTTGLTLLYGATRTLRPLPAWLASVAFREDWGAAVFFVLLVLLPLSMTMALIWKIKEVILNSVFNSH